MQQSAKVLCAPLEVLKFDKSRNVNIPGGYLCGFLLAFHKRKITTNAISRTVTAILS
jgi:hypothetical protein